MMTFRHELVPDDCGAIRDLVESTGVFSSAEAEVAVELAYERLAKGPASGYHFVLAEEEGHVRGYACYGPIACTIASYDLYWIAVRKSRQGRGLGQRLLAEVERLIRDAGGRRIYVETSSRTDYAPTRAFYQRCGYHREAVLADFYGPGDDKVIYLKVV